MIFDTSTLIDQANVFAFGLLLHFSAQYLFAYSQAKKEAKEWQA